MKKLFLNGKLAMMLLASLAFVMFSAGMCGDDNDDDDDNTEIGGGGSSQSEYKDKWAGLVNEDSKSVSVDGNTLTYGNHSYTVEGELDFDDNTIDHKTPTAWVKFTNIPSGYKEFKAVYEGLLGKSIQGTAAMIPMAFEIYARDFATGEKCLQLCCNSSVTVKTILSELKRKILLSKFSDENDSYIQRYLPAALLWGASYDNAYAPSEPYTVAMCPHVTKPQEIRITGDGTDYFVYILTSGGWDTFQRGVEIFQNYDGGLYKVFNCPSTYTGCRTIRGTWGGLK